MTTRPDTGLIVDYFSEFDNRFVGPATVLEPSQDDRSGKVGLLITGGIQIWKPLDQIRIREGG